MPTLSFQVAERPTLPPISAKASPLVLSDRLITLAQDADRAGFAVTAEHLVYLAHTIFEERSRLS
jgi:hypothetical protein